MAESENVAAIDYEKVKAELDAAQKTVSELMEFKNKAIAKEKEAALTVISSYIDVTPLKEEHLCTLQAVASALASYKKKLEEAPVVNSGASAVATTTETEKPQIPEGFASEEEYKAFLEAVERAKKHGREVK